MAVNVVIQKSFNRFHGDKWLITNFYSELIGTMKSFLTPYVFRQGSEANKLFLLRAKIVCIRGGITFCVCMFTFTVGMSAIHSS